MANENSLDLIFEGAELSEEAKVKIETIFEAKLNSHVQELEEKFAQKEENLKEQYETLAEQYVEEVVLEELSTKLDNYVDYVVENWMKENALAIENGVKVEMAENFINGIQSLFVENNVSVPENDIDVVSDLELRLQEMSEKFDALLYENVEMKNTLNENKKNSIISEFGKTMTDVQSEKLYELAESVEFRNEDDFRFRVNTLVNKFIVRNNSVIQEDIDMLTEEVNGDEKYIDPSVAAYVNAIKKFNK